MGKCGTGVQVINNGLDIQHQNTKALTTSLSKKPTATEMYQKQLPPIEINSSHDCSNYVWIPFGSERN
jgi:hypothetical protein